MVNYFYGGYVFFGKVNINNGNNIKYIYIVYNKDLVKRDY